jgi:hypothetical protein
MPQNLLPTSLVGSYARPDWLIDRRKLAGRFPPRVRAKELWRVAPEFLDQAQDDATLPSGGKNAPGLTSSQTARSGVKATPTAEGETLASLGSHQINEPIIPNSQAQIIGDRRVDRLWE